MVRRWHVEKDSTIVLPPERELWGFSELLRLYTEGLYDRFKILNIALNAGWFTAIVGSGAVVQRPARLALNTGTTANSAARAWDYILNLNPGNAYPHYIDWRKRLEIDLELTRFGSDPEATARFQLKESSAGGALAERGIGIEIQDLDIYGEGYGTSRGTVLLGTLTVDRPFHVKIILTDGVAEFWLDGVKAGELSGANVPQVLGTAMAYYVFEVVNGPTGGICFHLQCARLEVTQER